MNAHARIEPDAQTNWFAAWKRECEAHDATRRLLDKYRVLLAMETKRRRLAGEDVSHIEDFLERAA